MPKKKKRPPPKHPATEARYASGGAPAFADATKLTTHTVTRTVSGPSWVVVAPRDRRQSAPGADRRRAHLWDGRDRRAPTHPGQTVFGGLLVLAGIAMWVLFHEGQGGEWVHFFPMAVVILGAGLVDGDVLKNMRALLPWTTKHTGTYKVPEK